jgi:MYXO-CTERM domain-containing protein
MIHYGHLRGRNRDNEKGGTYRAQQVAVVKATRTGLEYVLPKTNVQDMLLGIDATHLTHCEAVFGSAQSLMPGFTLMQGSHNGGGVTEPIAKAVGYDVTLNKLIDLGTHRVGGSYDRHMYSNYLGNNPGNQGRNFAGCSLLKNPFAGQMGSTTQYFVAHALTGKSPDLKVRPELKPSSYVTLMPVATTIATTRSNLTAESDESSGCTSTGTAKNGGNGLLLLAAFGLLLAARRRA